MSQKRYNQEFKQTVVELYCSGTPVIQLSSEYDVSEVTICKWIKKHSPIEWTTQELTMSDVEAIQKENLRLKLGIEILKKPWPYSRENRWARTDGLYWKWKRTSSNPGDVSCLKMPRSAYYELFHKKPNSYHVANENLLERIKEIYKK